MTRQTHPFALILSLLCLAGCFWETRASHYSTRADAEADRLFERGWLPPLISPSARNITTNNDLDINTSYGEFHYDPQETPAFIVKMKPYSGLKPPVRHIAEYVTKQKARGTDAFEYSEGKSAWVFFVNAHTGHVQYAMWLR